MQSYILNEEEVDHIRLLRLITTGQKQAIFAAVSSLAANSRNLDADLPRNVIPIAPSRAG